MTSKHDFYKEIRDQDQPYHKQMLKLLKFVDEEEINIMSGAWMEHMEDPDAEMKIKDFLLNPSEDTAFTVPLLRQWLLELIVGTVVLQDNLDEEIPVTAVLYPPTHSLMICETDIGIIASALDEVEYALIGDIDNREFRLHLRQAYESIKTSVESFGILTMPEFDRVNDRVVHFSNSGRLVGLIREIDLRHACGNIVTLMNRKTRELALDSPLTIFVGGNVLNGDFTVPNLISVYYGIDSNTLDEGMIQEIYRPFTESDDKLLSVTRMFGTEKLLRRLFEQQQ